MSPMFGWDFLRMMTNKQTREKFASEVSTRLKPPCMYEHHSEAAIEHEAA